MAEEQAPQEEQKEKPVDCPAGAPAWMTTYSDLVTLLLTFFVLLLSMANMDPVRIVAASSSIKDAFGIQKSPAHENFVIPVLPSAPKTQFSPIQQQTTEKVYDEVKSQIDSLRLNNDVGLLKRDDQSIVLRIKDNALFERGKAKISPEAYSLLRTVADIIRPLPMNLRLEGHTDDIPAGTSTMGNWDLSVARAVSVLRFLTQSELLPLDRMSSVGYGKERPVVPNRDEETRAMNRRVDFVLRLKSSAPPGKSMKNSVPF